MAESLIFALESVINRLPETAQGFAVRAVTGMAVLFDPAAASNRRASFMAVADAATGAMRKW